MPLFDFQCNKCGHAFEELQGPGEKIKCPTCGSEDLRKLISAPATPKKFERNWGNNMNKEFKAKKMRQMGQGKGEWIKKYSTL